MPESLTIPQLRIEALATMEKAYAPFSNFKVGAALLSSNGNIYTGCNVENASYGLTVCAECNAISAMVAAGDRHINEIMVLSSQHILTTPCGACRQRIAEFSTATCQVHLAHGNDYLGTKTFTISELLPYGFEFSLDT